jgi:hypothetical protein
MFLTLDALSSAADEECYAVLTHDQGSQIAWTNSPEQSITTDTAGFTPLFACYRTETTVPAGTYTVRARWRRTAGGGTVVANTAHLAAFALSNVGGELIPSTYAEREDTDNLGGTLSDSMTLNVGNHAATFLATTTAIDIGNQIETSATLEDADSNTLKTESESRLYLLSSSHQQQSHVIRTDTDIPFGLTTVTGERTVTAATDDGVATQVAVALEAGSSSIIESSWYESEPVDQPATNSATMQNIPVTPTWSSLTLNHEAHIFAIMRVQHTVNTGGPTAQFAIAIDGTDYGTLRVYHPSVRERDAVVIACTATKLPPGTYQIIGRWLTNSGVLLMNAVSMFAMALDTTVTPEASSPSSSSTSSVSSSSATSLSTASSSLSSNPPNQPDCGHVVSTGISTGTSTGSLSARATTSGGHRAC